jgi:4-hydroxy-3-methylbut-2-enyl diphosphate reductase
MKSFDIPQKFRSGLVGRIKDWRKVRDPRKKELQPVELDFGSHTILLPRHFGFCYGVENAIEIAYKAVDQNPGKRIFLISQMIHNPDVNHDLESQGVRFILDTNGSQLIPWDEITKEDVVITPAFGTTVEIENLLRQKGVQTETYNTTCPFVEKVWKRSREIGERGYTVIIHGKVAHEETRATFSHTLQNAPSVIVRNMKEVQKLAEFFSGKAPASEFFTAFAGKYSPGFDPEKDLSRVGVVNQTTMLASETQEIADYVRSQMMSIYGDNWSEHFADTRDTLCYATNDNQDATAAVLESSADLAIVVGGYNSSNTIQILTILSGGMPSFFIRGADNIISAESISHYDVAAQAEKLSPWMGSGKPRIVITSGASCPDRVVDEVIRRVADVIPGSLTPEEVIESFFETQNT